MPDPTAKAGPPAKKAGKADTKTLLIVGGLAAAGGVAYLYFKKTPAAAASSSTAATDKDTGYTGPGMGWDSFLLFLHDHQAAPKPGPRGKTGPAGKPGKSATGGGPYRHVASGKQSLDQLARQRHTTVKALENETLGSKELDDENRRKFAAYIRGGTRRRMPKGLVYYTSRGPSEGG
jgi:arylsulfatase A-like enzyme